MIAQLDYVLSDALIMPDKDSRMLEIWQQIGLGTVTADAKDFMKRYVAFNLQVMDVEPIDILANATFLPDDIASTAYSGPKNEWRR